MTCIITDREKTCEWYQRSNHCKLKDRQHNGKKEKDQKNKQRFHLQKITQKTKDQVTRTPLKTDPAVMLFSALCLFLFFYSLFRYISRATCIIRSPFISIATVRLRSRKQSKRLTNTVQQEFGACIRQIQNGVGQIS